MNTLSPDDCIEGLKPFSSKKDSGSKTADVFWQMNKNMEFRLIEPSNSPARYTEEEVLYFVL